MFNNFESRVVGFYSCWEVEKNVNEIGCQTMEFNKSDKATSGNETCSNHSQTDNKEIAFTQYDVGWDKFSDRLNSAALCLLNELDTIESSDVFYKYDPYNEKEHSKINIALLQTLNIKSIEEENMLLGSTSTVRLQNIPISALCWNSTGSFLAASTGVFFHDSWCEHNSYINIFNKKNEKEFKFAHTIKLSTCCSCLAFHPSDSMLLAAATFEGEIIIWDLQHLYDKKDILLASNSLQHLGKRVNIITWLNSEQVNKYFSKSPTQHSEKVLISGGSDGKVTVWVIDAIVGSLNIKTCYELKSNGNNKIQQSLDISCMDFARIWDSLDGNRKNAEDYFAVGGKTGDVIICSTFGGLFTSQSSTQLCNLNRHNGSVLSLQFSPVNGTIFITLGMDKELRVYDILMDSPRNVLFLEKEFSVAHWIPNNSSLIMLAVAEISQESLPPLIIIDLTTRKEFLIENISEMHRNTAVTCLALNIIENMLAFGEMHGEIKMLSIPFKTINELYCTNSWNQSE